MDLDVFKPGDVKTEQAEKKPDNDVWSAMADFKVEVPIFFRDKF